MNSGRLKEEKLRFQRETEKEQEIADRKQQEKLNKVLAPINAERSAILAANEKKLVAYWRRPIQAIAKDFQVQFFFPDVGIEFETTDTPQPNAGKEAFAEFLEQLTPTSGYLMSDVAQHKLGYFGVSLCVTQNADLSSISNWAKFFHRMVALDLFGDDQLAIDENAKTKVKPVVEQPAAVPTIDDLESLNLSNPEDEKIAHDILSRAVFQGEAREVFREFLTHCKAVWGVDLSEEQQKNIILFFQKNNRSFLDRRAFDTCRVNLVKRGLLPSEMLTEDEILAGSVESEDTQSWEGRRRLKAELAASRNRI